MTKEALAITSYNHNTIFSPLIFKFGKNSAAVILNVMCKPMETKTKFLIFES